MSYQNARMNMVKQQLRTGDVLNESILNLYDVLPRDQFVPKPFAPFAYTDMQIPLGNGQRMLTPLEEGKMIQSLDLKGTETVLEIGTGSGFFTALLSKLCHKVVSIDYYAEFTNKAKILLKEHECDNIELITGNANEGWLDLAPYDVIVFTGAKEKITDTQKLQILPGGKLLALIGQDPVIQARLYTLDHQEHWHESLLFETNIPLLIDPSRPKKFVF